MCNVMPNITHHCTAHSTLFYYISDSVVGLRRIKSNGYTAMACFPQPHMWKHGASYEGKVGMMIAEAV